MSKSSQKELNETEITNRSKSPKLTYSQIHGPRLATVDNAQSTKKILRQSTKSSFTNQKDQLYDDNGLIEGLTLSDMSEDEDNQAQATQSDNSYRMLT